MSRAIVITLVVVGCILLIIANVALWASINVLNPDNFGRQVAAALQSDASSEAVAGAIVDRIIELYPDFPPLVRGPAEEVITWLLQRPAFNAVFRNVAAVANTVMTTGVQGVVGIDLSDVAPQVVGVVTAINPEAGAKVQAAIQQSRESGRLAIYESSLLPKLRGLANAVPWIWPLTGLAAIALFIAAYLGTADRRRTLAYIGIGVFIIGILSLLLSPALTAPVQNNVTNPSMRVVLGQVLSTLLWGLTVQSLILIAIGVVLFVVSFFIGRRRRSSATTSVSP